MPNWRDHILQHFTEPTHRLTLVADPDSLLLEERLLATIRAQGFDLLPFDDVVAFRYTYEANYRRHWDDEQSTPLVVILRLPEASLQTLPYDLLQSGRQLCFSLPELFPRLSYPVVKTLEPAHLQLLYEAYQHYDGPEMGDQASKAFILRHVFSTTPDAINTQLDLFKLLLARHSHGKLPPAFIDDFLQAKLREKPVLAQSPLLGLLRDPAEFFAFLQAEWAAFLASTQSPELLTRENGVAYIAEPTVLVAHPEIRGYLHTLFVEGKLKSIPLPTGWRITDEWAKIGVITQSPEVEEAQRFGELLEQLKNTIPAADASYKDWLRFAALWAELVMLRRQTPDHLTEAHLREYETLHLTIEMQFADWLLGRYHTLPNQPYHSGPVMGHHIPAYLATCRRQSPENARIALIVVDGLALDQWLIIREVWQEQAQPWAVQTNSLFAWAPTLTSIARQAIFAGLPPYLFPDSWQTTNKERKQWQRFWQQQGVPLTAIGYARNLGTTLAHLSSGGQGVSDGDILELEVLRLIENPRMQMVGLVINAVDNIMHGMQLGTAGMHQQLRQWLTDHQYLTKLVRKLLNENFTIFLTADHGNVAVKGIGRPKEGALVETRGQRARIYTDPAFLDMARQQNPEAVVWPNIGLPSEIGVLLAPKLDAFLDVNVQAVCHGGIALEEVIVPFIQITKKEVV
ncbi:MAG: BREX-3 system phosphatase PglZ [Anaerolineae bacterium]|nr:BREX-3 system phosphatase PglZ [Anaerolineae bacterium]